MEAQLPFLSHIFLVCERKKYGEGNEYTIQGVALTHVHNIILQFLVTSELAIYPIPFHKHKQHAMIMTLSP